MHEIATVLSHDGVSLPISSSDTEPREEQRVTAVRRLRVVLLALVLAIGLAPTQADTVNADHPATVYWLFAHPDDETLAAGAALAEHNAAGLYNIVVFLTRGEATGVCPQIGLNEAQCIQARINESAAATSDVSVDRVDRWSYADGGLTSANVRSVIDHYVSLHDPSEDIRFKGHSPNDTYAGLTGGHPDHKAIGDALVFKYNQGAVDDLRMYCLGHLFGESYHCGAARVNPTAYQTAKRAAIAEYQYVNHSIGRYGIGYQSVPGAFDAAYPYGSSEQIDYP